MNDTEVLWTYERMIEKTALIFCIVEKEGKNYMAVTPLGIAMMSNIWEWKN